MILTLHKKSLAALLLLSILFVGCSMSDDYGDCGDGQQSATAYVSLTFTAPSGNATRSNPTGGESGDGTENGQSYENTISDAVAFLYKDENGVNGEASDAVTAVYFDKLVLQPTTSGMDRTYMTESELVNLSYDTYHVLVVANPGTDWWSDGSLTLGDVRDHIQQTAWTEEGGNYSDFVMTSESDATIAIEEGSTYDNPSTAEVNVERMAARVDYKADAEYTCTDNNYTGAKVEITGACIVNNLTAGSYLIKRVAETVDGTPDYLGDETANNNGVGTNYVIDPWTAGKTADNIDTGFTINGESGKGAGDLYGTWWSDADASDPEWWAEKASTPTPITVDGTTWQRIGYTLENTTSAANSSRNYNTAVVFKAKFTPTGISNYAAGNTFFALGDYLFASMEDLMTYVYKDDFANFDSQIEACTTWDDVKTFAASLLDNDPSGYKTFLTTKAEGQSGDLSETDDLKWSTYMLSECGYSATLNGTYTIILDQNDKNTAVILAEYGSRTYVDATCYYTWWLRHANDGDNDTNGVMEFATVRNNIYKLTVQSVYSLGGYIPDDENIVIIVYVKDWTLLEEETLDM